MFDTALCQAVPLPAEGAPEWLHLLPAGEIRTYDGRGPYRVPDQAALALQSLQELGRLPLDENHATDLAAPKGGPSPARGWIVGLEAREDGIWGRIEWTGEGVRLVEDKAYRHISPVIAHDKSGRVTRILRASLTNRPNLRGLSALHSEGAQMEFLEKLRAELGLPDEAGETDALAAIKALKTSVSAHATEIGAIAAAAGLDKEADTGAVLQAVQERADPAKFVPVEDVIELQQQLVHLTAERTELQEDGKRTKAEAFVDGQIQAGKPGVKPLRDHYITRHMAEPGKVERELNALPSLTGKSGATETPPNKGGTTGDVSPEELRIVQLMGVDPKAYAATKAAIGAVEEAL